MPSMWIGQPPGLFWICRMAWSSSETKAFAAEGLRSAYHAYAASASATASGWNLTLRAATGSSENLAARYGPGDRFYPPPVKIVNAARNLFAPSQFSIFIN